MSKISMSKKKETELIKGIKQSIVFIGDDPNREGLMDTPHRIIKSWGELYEGYKQDPKEILTATFSSEEYSQMIWLKNIEIYSMCEHHMLPFYGKAHIAYIPKNKVVGISKLARLAECFARRLQIQERLTEQITDSIMTYLEPDGAACLIEACHMCMRMRGISKQNSTMVTSSLKGVFVEPEVRSEFMEGIK